MNRLFVSDLHLTEADHPHFHTFRALLSQAAPETDEIYLLGDLCEVWVGDDDDGPLARAFVGLLAEVAERTPVFVMPGNRDFLFGERFERESGTRLIADPSPIGDGIVLAHGDTFCIDDAEYQAARRLLRSAEWREDVLSRPLAERRALARAMREQSLTSNANKAENIMDVSTAEVARVMTGLGARTLIHGHTHRPGVHPESWGRRYVLGAWERCAWYLTQRGEDLSLRCVALTV